MSDLSLITEISESSSDSVYSSVSPYCSTCSYQSSSYNNSYYDDSDEVDYQKFHSVPKLPLPLDTYKSQFHKLFTFQARETRFMSKHHRMYSSVDNLRDIARFPNRLANLFHIESFIPFNITVPITNNLILVRKLQNSHFSAVQTAFFLTRHKPFPTSEISAISKLCPQFSEHTKSDFFCHRENFFPSLALIRQYTFDCPQSYRPTIMRIILSSHYNFDVEETSASLSLNYSDIEIVNFSHHNLFAQSKIEQPNVLKAEMHKFIANEPNCLKSHLTKMFKATPQEYSQNVSTVFSVLKKSPNTIPQLIELLRQSAPANKVAQLRSHDLYSKLYTNNRSRHVQQNRQKLRDLKLEAQGFFDLNVKLPANVNDFLAKIITHDENGNITLLFESINRFEKTFTEISNRFKYDAPFAESLTRIFSSFALFLLTVFTCNEKLAWFYSALNFVNAFPREWSAYFLEHITLFLTQLAKSATTKVKNAFNLNAQTLADDNSENIISCFAKYLYTLLDSKDGNAIKVEDIRIKRIVNISRMIQSSKNVADFLQNAVLSLRDIVTDLVFGTSDYIAAFETIDHKIPEWIRQVNEFDFCLDNAGKIVSPILELSKYEQKVKLITLLREGEEIFKHISAFTRCPPRLVRYVELKLNRIRELVKSISATLVGMKSKHEPYTIYLWGAPGVGKSILSDFLMKDVYSALGEEYDFVRDKYMKSETSLFWDGYDHQRVFVMDDVFQVLDSTVRTLQTSDIMHIGSRCPYPLNMADCSSKGAVNFSSEVFIMSSNTPPLKHEIEKYIISFDAFDRRILSSVEVTIKPEYKDVNGRFNQDLALDEAFVRTAYFFRCKSRDGSNFEGSWNDFVLHLAHKKEVHSANQRKLDLTLESQSASFRTKYEEYKHNLNAEGLSDVWNHFFRNIFAPSTFGIKFLPTLNIVNESEEAKQQRQKYLWAADPSQIPLEYIPPRKVTEEELIFAANYNNPNAPDTPHDQLQETPFQVKLHEVRRLFPRTTTTNNQYENDCCKTALFLLGLLPNERLDFSAKSFRDAYENIRSTAHHTDTRFSQAQHELIYNERYDILLIRKYLVDSRFKLDASRLTTPHGTRMWMELQFEFAKMPRISPIEDDYNAYRSTVKYYLQHPVVVALGTAVSIFSAIAIYKKFFSSSPSDKIPSDPTKWKEMASEAKLVSGDSVTQKARRLRFVATHKYFAEGKLSLDELKPHPHKCESCENFFAHAHIHDPTISHYIQPFSCPYESCAQYYQKSPTFVSTLYSRPPHHACKIAQEDVEYIDEPLAETSLLSEMERDPQCMVQMRIFSDHVLRIRVRGSGLMNGIVVRGRTVVMPYHAFYQLDTPYGATIEVEGKILPKLTFTLGEEFVIDREKDLILFNLPKQVNSFKDISNHFTSENEYISTLNDGYIIKFLNSSSTLYQQVTNIKCYKQIDYNVPNVYTNVDEKWYIPVGFTYDSDTECGDCGSPILTVNSGIIHKALGIHVAGGRGVGALTPITPAWFNIHYKALSDMSAQMLREEVDPEFCEEFFDCVDYPIHSTDNIQIIGKVPKKYSIFKPTDTSIMRSPLYESVFPVATRPSLLKRKGTLDPLRNDLIKQCTKEVLIDEYIVEAAVTDLSNVINALKSPYKGRKELSLHENVNGIPGDPYVQAINFQSAVGFPWTFTVPNHGTTKEKYFPGEENCRMPIPQVAKALEELESKCANNIIPAVLFVDSLKDERRPHAKVLAGKTRIFSVPPVEFTLIVRKYFQNFVAHVMHNHVFSECSVGLNVHGDEWGLFFKHAKSIGHNWIAGDYGGYDKRLPYQVCMAALKVVDDFYNDSNDTIRLALGETMFSSLHIAGGVIYQTHHGMPSGVPITAVFNSIVNALLFRIAFIELSLSNNFSLAQSLVMMRDCISIRAYGDDHIVRVHNSCGYFNMLTVSQYFESIGLEYTTTSKGEVLEKYVPEEDLSYLKRKFVDRNGVLFAPLEMQSIQEMINYIRKCTDPVEAFRQNFDAALREMTHYPKKEWTDFYEKVRRACFKSDLEVSTFTFEGCLAIQRSGDTANYDVILPEIKIPHDKGNAIVAKESSRTFLGPSRNASGSLNIGCGKSAARSDCSPAKKLVRNTQFNLNAQGKLQSLNFVYEFAIGDSAHYSFDKSVYCPPNKADLKFEFESQNDDQYIFRLITIAPAELIQVHNSESVNLKFANILFSKLYTKNGYQYFSASKHVISLPDGASLLFRYDHCVDKTNHYILYITPSKLITILNRDLLPTPRNLIFDYDSDKEFPIYTLSHLDHPEIPLDDGLFFSLTKESNNFGWFKLNLIDKSIEVKNSSFCIPNNTQPISMYYQYTEQGKEVFLCDMGTFPTVDKDMSLFLGYWYTENNKSYYRLKYIHNNSLNLTAQGMLDAKTDDLQPERQELTMFLDSSTKNIVRTVPRIAGLESVNPYPSPTLENFWCRPFPVYEGTWKASDTGMIANLIFPHLLFNINSFWDKISNFRFCNFDLEITVRVNGTQFHFGQLMLNVMPNALNGLIANDDRKNTVSSYQNIYTASGFKHILISPTENEVQRIAISYVLPKPFIDLGDLISSDDAVRKKEDVSSNIACVGVWVTAPLNGSEGFTSVNYAVFARLVNPTFTGFCQNDNTSRYSDLKHYTPKIVDKKWTELDFNISTNWTKKTTSHNLTAQFLPDHEADKKAQDGTLSSAIESVVSEVASLGIRAIGNELGLYTRPNDVTATQPVMLKYPNMSITHGLNEGYTLGINEENHIACAAPLMGSFKGEMDITHIISRYAFIGQASINQASKDGERLIHLPVTPAICHSNGLTTPPNFCIIYHTALSAVASRFRFWRGDITFRFDFICSSFHNARVRIGWIPKVSPNSRTAIGNIAESNFINKIVDISTQTQVEFTVPYLNDEPFLARGVDESNGLVFMTLLNAVAYPEKTIPKVLVNVWVKGESNFKFAGPAGTAIRRWEKVEDTNIHACWSTKVNKVELHAQGDVSQVLPGSAGFYNGTMFGEDIVNIKELCMKPYVKCYYKFSDADLRNKLIALNPYLTDRLPENTKDESKMYSNENGGHFRFFSQMFRFFRSSFTHRIVETFPTDYTINAMLNFVPESWTKDNDMSHYFEKSYFPSCTRMFSHHSTVVRCNSALMPSFHIPYITSRPFLATSVDHAGAYSLLPSVMTVVYSFQSTSNIVPLLEEEVFIYENPSDDLELGYQIGMPGIAYDINELFSTAKTFDTYLEWTGDIWDLTPIAPT